MRKAFTFGGFHPADVLLLGGAAISIAWSVYFSLVMIFIPHQIELREAASQVLTGFLLRGENPYILENQPLAMNQYGFGYNLAVLPLATLFGNTLSVHRLVTFVFILLSGWIVCVAIYKINHDVSQGLAGSAFTLIALIAHGGIAGSPGGMGSFLFLFAVLLPFLRGFDRRSLLVSALVALAAFLTKPYFLLSFGVVASYLFLFVSKRKAVLYGLFFFIVFLILLIVLRYLSPLYFITIFISNASHRGMTVRHLFVQLLFLAYFLFPVLLFYVFTAIRKMPGQHGSHPEKRGRLFNFREWQQPRISQPWNFPSYFLLCCLAAFIFILGLHEGNFMNYAYQLLVPSFSLFFFQKSWPDRRLKTILMTVVLFNLFLLNSNLQTPQMLSQADAGEWRRVFDSIHQSRNTLNPAAVTSEIVALGQSPYDSGQTSYYFEVEPFRATLLTAVSYEQFVGRGDLYVELLDGMIREKQFDLVITVRDQPSFYHEELLPDYYYQADQVNLEMPQVGERCTLILWKPLPE